MEREEGLYFMMAVQQQHKKRAAAAFFFPPRSETSVCVSPTCRIAQAVYMVYCAREEVSASPGLKKSGFRDFVVSLWRCHFVPNLVFFPQNVPKSICL